MISETQEKEEKIGFWHFLTNKMKIAIVVAIAAIPRRWYLKGFSVVMPKKA